MLSVRYDVSADGIIFATYRISSPNGKRILTTLPHVRLDLVISVVSLSKVELSDGSWFTGAKL
jgi:hypothetical protein